MQDLTSSATLHHPAPREAIGDWILPAKATLNEKRVSKVALAQRALCVPAQKPVANPIRSGVGLLGVHVSDTPGQPVSSQRSLHNAPIFRLLLKVAVKGAH